MKLDVIQETWNTFNNVEVWASNDWDAAADASIFNLCYEFRYVLKTKTDLGSFPN